MYLGRVVGRVWSTVKHPGLGGQRLLIVQPVNPERKPTGRRVICTDWAGARAGDIVYWCRGRESSFAFLPDEVPTDFNIVGLVDTIHLRDPEPGPGAPPC